VGADHQDRLRAADPAGDFLKKTDQFCMSRIAQKGQGAAAMGYVENVGHEVLPAIGYLFRIEDHLQEIKQLLIKGTAQDHG
jgi:hypothetical protein